MVKQSKEEIALQLKSAVYFHVAKIVEQKLNDLNQQDQQQQQQQQGQQDDDTSNITATPMFTAQLVELVFNQLINLGEDLELFCQHGNRNIVEPKDIYMVARKNPTLQQFLKDIELNIGEHHNT